VWAVLHLSLSLSLLLVHMESFYILVVEEDLVTERHHVDYVEDLALVLVSLSLSVLA